MTFVFPSDLNAFDIHHHIGNLALGATARVQIDVPTDMDLRLRQMDRYGIARAGVMPSLQYERADAAGGMRRANEQVAAYRDTNPDRFPIAIGVADPLLDTATSITEMRRAVHRLGMRGFTWHHRFQGLFLSDERMAPLLEACVELSVPALIHMFADSNVEAPWMLEQWAARFPELTLVALDAFTSSLQANELLGIGRRCPNVMFETAGSFPLGRIIETFVGELGAGRVLFGSDFYTQPRMWDYPAPLLEITTCDTISAEDRDLVLRGNAEALFER